MRTALKEIRLIAMIGLIAMVWMACDSSGDSIVVEDSSANVSGVVRDANDETPLSDIRVKLITFETTTDQDGRFAFQDVPVGSWRLEAGTTGYDTYAAGIDVQAGENKRDISLIRAAHYQFLSEYGNYDLYLPPGIPTFRGVIFLGPPSGRDTRGFASGIPRTTMTVGENELVEAERDRSLLLAEKHGLALMGSQGGALSQETTSAILAALLQFADESAHPELAQAPLLMMGFSVGGCLAYEFAKNHPERTIGFTTQKGGCHESFRSESAKLVPGYLFIGETDTESRFDNITHLFEESRPLGALWALAVEPGADHTPVCDHDLLFNWMDIVLDTRLPETIIPGSPVALNALDETSGWLGDRVSFATAAFASYTEDKLQASWLPTQQTAQDWQAFVSGVNAAVNCP